MADPNSPSDVLARQIAQLRQRRERLLVQRAAQVYKLAAVEKEESVLQDINTELKTIHHNLLEKIKRQDAMNEEMRKEIDFWRNKLYEAVFPDDSTEESTSSS
uniref:uncharacterized protein LOC105349650 n=1 Tax=Fragaria vesca subsp. vesca TaxID=101020 RepID=UPI0005CAB806|nr:PREDICTED: uncharacterized protein LOC105349650 [Fragaria vesca subsp. vesca]